MFTTGSDRVLVGEFAKLKLIIAKNGADSDRLARLMIIIKFYNMVACFIIHPIWYLLYFS